MDKRIHPVVELKNGLKVANFSSPHPFRFCDGSLLEACPPETVEAGKLIANEVITEKTIRNTKIQDIKLDFELTDDCLIFLFFLAKRTDVDIVLVPLPVMECVKKFNGSKEWKEMVLEKIRVVRVKDRTSKVIYSDKFCI